VGFLDLPAQPQTPSNLALGPDGEVYILEGANDVQILKAADGEYYLDTPTNEEPSSPDDPTKKLLTEANAAAEYLPTEEAAGTYTSKATTAAATDPLAHLSSVVPFAQFNARPAGLLWPQAFSFNETAGELYTSMSGSLDGGATNSLRISVRNLDGTIKSEKTITVPLDTSSEGLPWFYNGAGDLCFVIRPASLGVGYAIYNYTTNTVGPNIAIQGNFKSDVEGNLFATCDASSSTSGVGAVYLYDWASVQAGTPTLLTTVRLEVRNTMNKVQSFAINGGHIIFSHGASKTEPYISVYTMTGKLVTAFQMDKPTFADAINSRFPGTITNRLSYRHESEGAATYKGAVLTGHVTDNNTSSYLYTILMHNRIDGARVKALPQYMAYDTGWVDITLASGILVYGAGTNPQYRRIGDIIYMRGAVKGLPTSPSSVLVGTMPAGPATTQQATQVTSSGKTANWQINTGGSIYVLNSGNAGDATSWFPLPGVPLIAT